jgi:3-dehydroquinate dehydratase/shikimate dehydrogenase
MPAAVEVLSAALATRGRTLASSRIAVLGAGGVARAVAGGLALAGATVVVFNRNHERAEALATSLSGKNVILPDGRAHETKVVAGRADALACGCFHAFVNCTPVGMQGGPDPSGSPLPDDVHLDDSVVVMDTVYTPRDTPLLREARARGAVVVDGEAMFLRQAELQSELFRSRW